MLQTKKPTEEPIRSDDDGGIQLLISPPLLVLAMLLDLSIRIHTSVFILVPFNGRRILRSQIHNSTFCIIKKFPSVHLHADPAPVGNVR